MTATMVMTAAAAAAMASATGVRMGGQSSAGILPPPAGFSASASFRRGGALTGGCRFPSWRDRLHGWLPGQLGVEHIRHAADDDAVGCRGHVNDRVRSGLDDVLRGEFPSGFEPQHDTFSLARL